jgi:hypothetical protein
MILQMDRGEITLGRISNGDSSDLVRAGVRQCSATLTPQKLPNGLGEEAV